ncbi:MAG: hypothetical protein K0R38_341 [Polyangiaceae bacterium]|jgi:hypothetical protein|nr:hypothetical protein [Polyangiaceae bacterium]
MRRKVPARAVWINVVGVAVALLVALFGISFRSAPGGGEAWAQTPPPPAPPSAAAAGSVAPPASAASAVATPAASGDAVAPAGSAGPDPIDLAVAPKGGVPFHPSGTAFKSPFAKPNADKPVRIKVGMLLNSVDEYDVQSGTFLADFFLSFTSETPMPEISPQFPNGKVDSTTVIADKPTFKLMRLSGQFKSPADLRKYPYDSQELKILVEDDSRGVDQIRFVVDRERTKTARGFRAVGWQVSFVEARSLSQSYPDRFENDDLFYGRYVFTVGLDRFAASAVFKVYVPALVIVLISLLGMWVPPAHMEVRSNAGAPMLAGAVLFHFSLMQELPATSYLTRADKLMLGVYASLLLGMLSTWFMFLVDEGKMDNVFRIARVIVPIATVVVMGLAMYI